MPHILPTYRALLTFPPGVDRTDLAVVDETGYLVAATSWRPESTDSPASWDKRLVDLGWRRGGRWQATGSGIEAPVVWAGDEGGTS